MLKNMEVVLEQNNKKLLILNNQNTLIINGIFAIFRIKKTLFSNLKILRICLE
jgi:hypothetical protein